MEELWRMVLEIDVRQMLAPYSYWRSELSLRKILWIQLLLWESCSDLVSTRAQGSDGDGDGNSNGNGNGNGDTQGQIYVYNKVETYSRRFLFIADATKEGPKIKNHHFPTYTPSTCN